MGNEIEECRRGVEGDRRDREGYQREEGKGRGEERGGKSRDEFLQQSEAAVVYPALALPWHAEVGGPCPDLTCSVPDGWNSGFWSNSNCLGIGSGVTWFISVKGGCQDPA